MTLTPIPQNYRNSVDWILGAYTDAGVSFPMGFRKMRSKTLSAQERPTNGNTGDVTSL